MSLEKGTINCPKCSTEINVDTMLRHQLEREISNTYKAQWDQERQAYEKKVADLNQTRTELEAQKQQLDTTIQANVSKQLQLEKQKIETELRKTMADETADSTRSLQEELTKKTEQVKELNKAKADISKLMREKDELRSEIESEAERKLTEALQNEREKIQKALESNIELKLLEKEKLITQLTDQLKEAHRKAEQGSVQAQGEAQEIAIEKWLSEEFPFDTVEEVKKGARGADCIHRVNTQRCQNVGAIYYESKRTKEFQPSWIAKFKDDLRANGATFGVIVTETMPKDMERLGQKEGFGFAPMRNLKDCPASFENQSSNYILRSPSKKIRAIK